MCWLAGPVIASLIASLIKGKLQTVEKQLIASLIRLIASLISLSASLISLIASLIRSGGRAAT